MKKLTDIKVGEKIFLPRYSIIFWRGLYLVYAYTKGTPSRDDSKKITLCAQRNGEGQSHEDFFFEINRTSHFIKNAPNLKPHPDNYIIASHDNGALVANLQTDFSGDMQKFIETFSIHKLQKFNDYCFRNNYFEECERLKNLIKK